MTLTLDPYVTVTSHPSCALDHPRGLFLRPDLCRCWQPGCELSHCRLGLVPGIAPQPFLVGSRNMAGGTCWEPRPTNPFSDIPCSCWAVTAASVKGFSRQQWLLWIRNFWARLMDWLRRLAQPLLGSVWPFWLLWPRGWLSQWSQCNNI